MHHVLRSRIDQDRDERCNLSLLDSLTHVEAQNLPLEKSNLPLLKPEDDSLPNEEGVFTHAIMVACGWSDCCRSICYPDSVQR